MSKTSKPKIKLTIEMDKDGITHERIERTKDLTDQEEKKFWDCVKNADGDFMNRENLLKVFNEVFKF